MASILVIGVGSTGLAVMEQAQQFYYEFTGQDSPGANNSAFLFIETDSNRKAALTPNGTTDIKSCNMHIQNINATLTAWHTNNNIQRDWLPGTATVLNANSGAAGQPVYGRIALWANEQNVRQQINHLYKQIGGNTSTNIYIIGSFSGGTGSGMFLDLAYLVRNCTNNNNIYGTFLLPDTANVGNTGSIQLYENAYISLKSMDHFSQADVNPPKNYECTMPSGQNIDSLRSPFKNVQFLTTDFANADASLKDFNSLIQSAGFNLVLRTLNVDNNGAPFQDSINARYVDYQGFVPKGLFSTIGFAMFQYPEALLEEYFAIDLLENNILNRWIDNVHFIDHNSTQQTIQNEKNSAELTVHQFVENAISKSINNAKANAVLGMPDFKAAINREINNIISGNYKAPSQINYIFSLFDSNNNNNFYAAINGQTTILRNSLIADITKFIEDQSAHYQNFTLVEFILNEIVLYINTLINDLNVKYKFDGTPASWNQILNSQTDEFNGNRWIYNGCFAKKDRLFEYLNSTSTLLYYNVIINELSTIKDCISGVNNASLYVGNKPLPTIAILNSSITKIQGLLNIQNNQSIVSRKNHIIAQLQNTTNSQLTLLFKNNDYKGDIQTAKGKHDAGTDRLTIKDITANSPWSYILSTENNEIKSNMISKSLVFVRKLQLFDGVNITNLMVDVPDKNSAYNKIKDILNQPAAIINGQIPAMVKLNNNIQFENHKCLSLATISYLPSNNAQSIAQVFNNNYKPNANNNTYVELPSLKNTVVIYQEYAYMGLINGVDRTFSPLLDISYQTQVVNKIKERIANNGINLGLRLAYIDKDTLLNNTIKIQ